MSDEQKMKQIADQCRAVAHMARALESVHRDYAMMFDDSPAFVASIADMVGRRTASFMEQLGDMLNAMDAVSEEDEWIEPVFRSAQEMWPSNDQP